MAGRNDGNSNNKVEREHPASHPSRLDQFADEMFGNENKGYGEGVTSRKEKQKWSK